MCVCGVCVCVCVCVCVLVYATLWGPKDKGTMIENLKFLTLWGTAWEKKYVKNSK